MTISVRRTVAWTSGLALLGGAATALPQAAGAQAGSGPPVAADNALAIDAAGAPKRPEPPRCIHRSLDDRPGTSANDSRLTAWLSVRQPAIAAIKVSGSANSPGTGTFVITAMSDGMPIAYSQEMRGTGIIHAGTSAHVQLVPGRQYKITARPTVSYKKLIQFEMDVGIGGNCP